MTKVVGIPGIPPKARRSASLARPTGYVTPRSRRKARTALGAAHVHGEAQHPDPVARVPLVEPLEGRHLEAAGDAPRRPEVHDHHGALAGSAEVTVSPARVTSAYAGVSASPGEKPTSAPSWGARRTATKRRSPAVTMRSDPHERALPRRWGWGGRVFGCDSAHLPCNTRAAGGVPAARPQDTVRGRRALSAPATRQPSASRVNGFGKMSSRSSRTDRSRRGLPWPDMRMIGSSGRLPAHLVAEVDPRLARQHDVAQNERDVRVASEQVPALGHRGRPPAPGIPAP